MWISLILKADIQQKIANIVSNGSAAIQFFLKMVYQPAPRSVQIKPFFFSVWALKVILCINVYRPHLFAYYTNTHSSFS